MKSAHHNLADYLLPAFLIVIIITVISFWFPFSANSNKDSKPTTNWTDWKKLNASGEPVAIHDGPWHCVSDQATGLVWETKSPIEDTRYKKSTYTYVSQETSNHHREHGSCFGLRQCNTESYIAHVNRVKLCGYDDWRLPKLNELKSIIDDNAKSSEAKTCKCLFPATQTSSYWSDTKSETGNDTPERLGINFKTLETRPFPAHASLYIRLVRSDP